MLWIPRVTGIENFHWWSDPGNGERTGGGREETAGVWEPDRGGVSVPGAGPGPRGEPGGWDVTINRYIDPYRAVPWGWDLYVEGKGVKFW